MPSTDRPATMKDVATLAGVGLATVSRVVNGTSTVAPELVQRVTEASRKLGYRKDLTASSLRRADRKTRTIGLVLEDVSNPFSSALHRSVQEACRQRGILVIAGSNDEDPERERDLVETFTQRRVDGLILVPTGRSDEEIARARRAGTPIVCVDRLVDIPDVDNVTVDNVGGTRDAVTGLAALGHRRIGYLGDLDTIWTARGRYAGFAEALARAGLPLDARLVRRGLRGTDAAAQAVRELLTSADPPTAVFAAENLLTIGAVRALRDLDAHRRIALVGFDDFALADLLDPPVSVIAQDPAGIGFAAARLLLERLDGRDEGPARHEIVPLHHLPRGSGEIGPPTRA
ncbi:MAG: LacI family DNA-binding transcriptional regulator [Catenulispora sp.]